jgi:hypothetical protein
MRYVLMLTEFSYDRTCAVSSETRWVAPLKEHSRVEIRRAQR